MNGNLYAVDYIRRASNSESIEKPDAKKAGRFVEELESVYQGHQVAKAAGATMAWQTVAKMRPEIAEMYEFMKDLYPSTMLDQIPRLTYMLDQYPIYEGGDNLLIGARGTGKSFVAVDVACRIAQTDRVLYIAGEGGGVYDSRVKAWHDYHELPETGNLFFYGRPVDAADTHKFDAFERWVINDVKPVMIIIDTVARCMTMFGMSENDATDMGAFVNRWEGIKSKGVALLKIHHTNRAGSQRGSGVLDDAADSVLFLHKFEQGIAIRNDYEGGGKNRDRQEAEPTYFQIQSHEIAPKFVGEDSAAVLVKVEREMVHLDEVGETLSENQKQIIDLLRVDSMSAKDMTSALPSMAQSTLYDNLKAMKEGDILEKNGTQYSVTEKGERVYENS